jgi:hypothetical protein
VTPEAIRYDEQSSAFVDGVEVLIRPPFEANVTPGSHCQLHRWVPGWFGRPFLIGRCGQSLTAEARGRIRFLVLSRREVMDGFNRLHQSADKCDRYGRMRSPLRGGSR